MTDKITDQHLHPSGAVLWREFQELLVQFATSIELPQLQLQFNVTAKQFVFRTLADCCALESNDENRLVISCTRDRIKKQTS